MYAEISSALCRGLSATIRPSPRKITRSAWLAAIGSCVTIAIDWPWSRLAAASSAEHLATAARVEVAGRLVGEHEVGRGRERAGDRDALLLAAGELVRAVAQPVGEPEGLDEPVDAGALERRRPAAVEVERQQDVADRVERRHEVERLEDEPDAAAAQDRELEVGEAGDVGVADPRAAGGRGIQPGHDVHERRLARPGRAHDRGELAATDADAHAVERAHLASAGAVGLGELLHPGGEAQVCRCELSMLRRYEAGLPPRVGRERHPRTSQG